MASSYVIKVHDLIGSFDCVLASQRETVVGVMLIYTHCWELMNSVGSHGSSSLPFVLKVTVCHFVRDSHEVMTALIVVLPLIVVVKIFLQLHRSIYLDPLHWWICALIDMEYYLSLFLSMIMEG